MNDPGTISVYDSPLMTDIAIQLQGYNYKRSKYSCKHGAKYFMRYLFVNKSTMLFSTHACMHLYKYSKKRDFFF